jgi:nucleolar protein 15
MDNYLLMNHLLSCKLVKEVHPDLFKGGKFKKIPHNKILREKHNRDKTPEEVEKNMKRLKKKFELKMDKIKELGIKYDFNFDVIYY